MIITGMIGAKGWKAGGSEAMKVNAFTFTFTLVLLLLLLGFLRGELKREEQSAVIDCIPFSAAPPIVDGKAT